MAGFGKSLPPAVYFKHGAYYFVTQENGKNRWINLGNDAQSAYRKYRETVLKTKGDGYARRRIYSDDSGGPIPVEFIREMLRNAKKNAATRSLPITITFDDIKALAESSGGKCQLTGISFSYGVADEVKAKAVRRKRLWAPSLDRIDPCGGYELGNVRLVCAAVNIARQEFSDEVLLKIAKGLSKTAKMAGVRD